MIRLRHVARPLLHAARSSAVTSAMTLAIALIAASPGSFHTP